MIPYMEAIKAFMDAGGSVLWAIFFVSIILWLLLIERLLFFHFFLPVLRNRWLSSWAKRRDHISWRARVLRQKMLSEARLTLGHTAPMIRVLITIAPLLGLLGTVTGMITVFDVMAIEGSGNARAMASGVSRATIPTMAGMVIAIVGLFMEKTYRNKLNDELHSLSQQLQLKVD